MEKQKQIGFHLSAFGTPQGIRPLASGAVARSDVSPTRHSTRALRIPQKNLLKQNKNRQAFAYLFLARRKGFEPLTYWFVASYSIQLS